MQSVLLKVLDFLASWAGGKIVSAIDKAGRPQMFKGSIPMDIKLPIEWTSDDAGNLHAFLDSSTGSKCRQHLFFFVIEHSIPQSEMNMADPKTILGMNAMREEFLSLANVEQFHVAHEDHA